MSEVKGLWKAYNEAKKAKKAANVESSLTLLRARNIEHQVLDWANYHTLVAGRYHLWPSTGKWIDRKSGSSGRGVLNLIKRVEG